MRKATETAGCGGCTPIILALGKLRQKDQKFEASLGCIAKPPKNEKEGWEGEKEGREEGREGRREEGRREKWIWWYTPVMSALWRCRKEDEKWRSFSYIASLRPAWSI